MAQELIESAQQLVGKETLLKELFPNESDRPTTRWLDTQCAKGQIPFIRLGRLIWFNVPTVRASIMARTQGGRLRGGVR